eukprot:sb/3462173/
MVNSMLLALHSPVFAELIAEGTKVVELDESLQREDGMVEGVRLAVMILHGQQVTLDQPQLELCYAFAEMYQLELLVNLCLKEFGAMIEEEADFFSTFERLIKTDAKWPEALFEQLFHVVGDNPILLTQLDPDKLRECCRAAETRPVILGRLLWFLKDNSCLTRKHFTDMKFLAKFLNSKNPSSQPIVEFCMVVAREAVVESPLIIQNENQADLESRPSSASSSSKTRSFGSFHTEESSLPRSIGRGRGRHKSTSNSDNIITSPYNNYMGHKDEFYHQSFTSDQLGPQTLIDFNQELQMDLYLNQGLQTHTEIINGPQTDIDYVDWDELGITDSATGPYTTGVTTMSSLTKLRLNDSISSNGSMPQIVPVTSIPSSSFDSMSQIDPVSLIPLNSTESIPQKETAPVTSPTLSDSMPKVPTLFSVLELRDFLVSLDWLEFSNFDYFILLINVAHNLAKGGNETYLCVDALLHWTKKNNVSFDTEGFYEQFSNSLKSGLLDKTYLSDVKQYFSTFDGKTDREVRVNKFSESVFSVQFISGGIRDGFLPFATFTGDCQKIYCEVRKKNAVEYHRYFDLNLKLPSNRTLPIGMGIQFSRCKKNTHVDSIKHYYLSTKCDCSNLYSNLYIRVVFTNPSNPLPISLQPATMTDRNVFEVPQQGAPRATNGNSKPSPELVAEIYATAGKSFSKLAELTARLHKLPDSEVGGKNRWTHDELKTLRDALQRFGDDVEKISEQLKSRTVAQVRDMIKSENLIPKRTSLFDEVEIDRERKKKRDIPDVDRVKNTSSNDADISPTAMLDQTAIENHQLTIY